MKKNINKQVSKDILGLRNKRIKQITRKIVINGAVFLVTVIPQAITACGLKG